MGRSANGLMEWKDDSGRDLKSIEAKEIQKVNDQLNTAPALTNLRPVS